MHRPPAVAWKVVVTRWQKYLVTSMVLFAGLVWAGFTVGQGWGITSFAPLVVLLAAVLLAARAQRNAPIGQLRWDGEQWYWAAAQDLTVRTMVCVLDFQAMMLLQLICDNGNKYWFWLDAGDKPAHWNAMRRAIVASTKISREQVDQEPRGGHAVV